MELLVVNATVVTQNAAREVLRDAYLLVRDGRIVEVKSGKPPRPKGLRQQLDARGQVVIPGLIHAHLHACQTLFRNRADGLELLDWLRERIWPFEAAHDAASLRASAELTFLELLKGGCTALLDMGTVRHYGQVFEAARDCGIRLVGGKAMMDAGQGVPAGLRETTEASLAESVALIERWHGQEDGRLRYALAPRFVLSCTEGLLTEVAALSKSRGVRIHTHASENPTECDVVREKVGMDNVAYFGSLGLLGPQTTLAHCVWLTAQEQKLVKDTGTHICHCPGSNLKLASGYAKLPELLEAGLSVALGADGAPCNNNLDLFQEMRLAALMHLPRKGPTAIRAAQIFELATLGGARALGLEAEVGSLEPGKRADFALVDLSGPHVTPSGDDVVSQLVYSAQSRDVTDVVVDGRLLVKNRVALTLDEPRILADARRHAERIAAQVG
ncbi:MAG: 5'-deoxyadenosine deaminase [Myxococcaceae bacterium]|nr:5'-deoxyadenosine deaminase [Myxococcaceae bacterium]